jgi:hypothetical protein
MRFSAAGPILLGNLRRRNSSLAVVHIYQSPNYDLQFPQPGRAATIKDVCNPLPFGVSAERPALSIYSAVSPDPNRAAHHVPDVIFLAGGERSSSLSCQTEYDRRDRRAWKPIVRAVYHLAEVLQR